MSNEAMMLDEAKNAGYRIISIPSNLKFRIQGRTDISGKPIRDLSQFTIEYGESFEFKFVDPTTLTEDEKRVFDKTDEIFRLIGGKPRVVAELKISETMKKQLGTFAEADGIWEGHSGRIIVKRSTLLSMEKYAGTLLHEVAHAISGADDVNREFESKLTDIIGTVSSKALQENKDLSKPSRRRFFEI